MKEKQSDSLHDGVDFERCRLLSIKQTADYLGIRPGTIYNGISPKSKKPFPVRAKRVLGRVLFDLRDLERFVDNL